LSGWLVAVGLEGRADVKAGDLPGQAPAARRGPAEVRAAIVAWKRGNARGAKGGRKANEPRP
jgi:hypothetical protein